MTEFDADEVPTKLDANVVLAPTARRPAATCTDAFEPRNDEADDDDEDAERAMAESLANAGTANATDVRARTNDTT